MCILIIGAGGSVPGTLEWTIEVRAAHQTPTPQIDFANELYVETLRSLPPTDRTEAPE